MRVSSVLGRMDTEQPMWQWAAGRWTHVCGAQESLALRKRSQRVGEMAQVPHDKSAEKNPAGERERSCGCCGHSNSAGSWVTKPKGKAKIIGLRGDARRRQVPTLALALAGPKALPTRWEQPLVSWQWVIPNMALKFTLTAHGKSQCGAQAWNLPVQFSWRNKKPALAAVTSSLSDDP